MSTSVSSKRYAQAVYMVAQKSNSFDKWLSDLKKIAGLNDDNLFADVIDNPKVPFDLKSKLAKALLGQISPETANFVDLLIIKNKFKNISRITEEYESLINEHYGIKLAKITTAVKLDESSRDKLSRQIETILGSKAKFEFSVVPSIIGGFIARVDGSLIDASIQNKLDLLRKNMC